MNPIYLNECNPTANLMSCLFNNTAATADTINHNYRINVEPNPTEVYAFPINVTSNDTASLSSVSTVSSTSSTSSCGQIKPFVLSTTHNPLYLNPLLYNANQCPIPQLYRSVELLTNQSNHPMLAPLGPGEQPIPGPVFNSPTSNAIDTNVPGLIPPIMDLSSLATKITGKRPTTNQ